MIYNIVVLNNITVTKNTFKIMAENLNQKAGKPAGIESEANANAPSEFINGVHLKETKEAIANTLNEYFNDGLHLNRLEDIADEHANWVYFGVGGPA